MRLLKKEEYDLIVYLLIGKPQTEHLINKLSKAMVEEMNDGDMGSLKFLSETDKKRIMKDEIANISLLY